MTVHFACVTEMASPRPRVFDLSLSVEAHLGSMARSGERVVGGVRSGIMNLGDEVTWAARHFGIPFRMTSHIVELDRPTRFVDEQVRGPFARFRHEHLFEVIEQGTRMTDAVEFDAPFGPVGDIAERLVLRAYLKKLIRSRADYLRRVAESDER